MVGLDALSDEMERILAAKEVRVWSIE